jgi:serine/threonine protein kinase
MLAKNKKSGEFFAMKRLKKADIIKLRQVDHVISENTILADIDHPFLVSNYNRLTNNYIIGWAQRIFSRYKILVLFNGVHRGW